MFINNQKQKRYENHHKNEDKSEKFVKVQKVSWDNGTFYMIRFNNVWKPRKSPTQNLGSPKVDFL